MGLKERVGSAARSLLQTGFFNIFGSSVVNRVIIALLGIALVRIVDKADYGVYAYANNIISLVLLVNGLAASSTMLQLCSETHEKEGLKEAYSAYAYRAGLAFDVVLALAVLLIGAFVPLAVAGSGELLCLYALYPLLYLAAELGLTRLRCDLRNKEYAFATNVQTVLLAACSVGGALAFGARGLVVGQSVACALSAALIAWRYGLLPDMGASAALTKGERSDYWSISLISVCNNGLSQALSLLGNFLIGTYLGSSELVADYKVATTIPYALLFVPTCVVIYIYPYFAKHAHERNWCLTHFRTLMLANGGAMVAITVGLWALATPITELLFGEAYLDTVPVFRVLLLGFLANSCARQICGNLLVTQRRVRFNFVVGVLSLVLNLVLSLVLIPRFQMMGAAWAYVATMAAGAVANAAYYIMVAGRAVPGAEDAGEGSTT